MAAGARSARDGNLPQADREFKTAYALRPWDSDTALLAAQAFAGPATSGNKEAAAHTIEWAKISLAKTPDSVEAGLALSIGYINSGDLSTAKQQLDRLISRAPYTTGLYVQRGIANFGLGRPDQSIADLRTAASQSPFSPEPWQIMARIYERLGLLDQAKTAQARANALL
jgi:predicted Zn-dependent protease